MQLDKVHPFFNKTYKKFNFLYYDPQNHILETDTLSSALYGYFSSPSLRGSIILSI